jgi:predicted nucleotidyltransferase/HEPN domain-containing protein
MQNSITGLPALKKEELKKITNLITASSEDVEKIILYGSYARGGYKEEKDLKPDRKSGHVSDYDILIITSKKRLALDTSFWNKISEKLQDLNTSAIPRILTIDIESLNIKLAEGQYFYSDIKKEGVMLFDAKGFELAKEGVLSTKERKRVAQDHFDYWFKRSKKFYELYQYSIKGEGEDDSLEDNGVSAFQLHQAAESSYKSVLLVFSNHCPCEHFLEFLGKNAEKYHKLMANIFSKISQEDEARFKLLEYAYIGGRYDPNYKISKKDLDLLAVDVKRLLELTKEVCEERIARFGT